MVLYCVPLGVAEFNRNVGTEECIRRREKEANIFFKYYNSEGSDKNVMKGITEVIKEI